LLGQFEKILKISNSEAGMKEEKSAGVAGGEDKWGDDVVGLVATERRSLDILSVFLYFICEERGKAVSE